jgi:hypothetical protein
MKVRYTVPSAVTRAAYVGNDVTTVFSAPFNFFDDTDLDVILVNDTTAVETTQILTTNYTVTGGDGSSGSVTMLVAPPTGTTLVIERNVPFTQEIDLEPNDPFPAEVTEEGFDRSVMLAQQNKLEIQKSPKLPPTYDPDSDPEIRIPVPVAGKVLIGNSGATGWENTAIADLNVATIPVTLTSQANQDLLEYESAGATWKNQTLATVLKRMLTTAGDIAVNIAGTVSRLAVGSAGQVLTVVAGAPAWATPTVYGFTGVRQTVQHGPVTTAGLPSFLPSTDADLNLVSQNISASYPLVVSAANGGNASGAVNLIGASTENLTWTGLTASRAAATPNFLYVTVSAAGVLTPGFTLVAPVYQWGGTPATTSGLYTFNISEMKGYLGNGSTAPQTNLVMVGEAATDGTGVISTVAYAYNGQYENASTATLSAALTAVSTNHNLGIEPQIADLIIECTTTDNGYAVGDQLPLASIIHSDATPVYRPTAMWMTKKAMGYIIASTGVWATLNKSSGVVVGLTRTSWKYKFVARRRW